MNIAELQKLLGVMFRETYKGDTEVQMNILELGKGIKRLLEKGALNPFEDYEENKKKIFNEMRQIKND
ncbi:hypothetical protein [Staphylococcus equorum]|uniref:hypothetical protein n=1 Tax=Staphylococcus equorum TaxID=246432 RepID=UPI003CF5012D